MVNLKVHQRQFTAYKFQALMMIKIYGYLYQQHSQETNFQLNNDDITKPGQLKQWKYLEPVVNQLNFEENISVGLLIGANCTKALEPIQLLQGRNGSPYAFSTRLG